MVFIFKFSLFVVFLQVGDDTLCVALHCVDAAQANFNTKVIDIAHMTRIDDRIFYDYNVRCVDITYIHSNTT